MAPKLQPLPTSTAHASNLTSDSDYFNRERIAPRGAAADPDFEDKIELKFEDCPEATGFAYPS